MLTASYVHGTSTEPLLGETIGVNFDQVVARYPDEEALVVCHQGVRWTYRELGRRVDAVAAGLIALGLELRSAKLPALRPTTTSSTTPTWSPR